MKVIYDENEWYPIYTLAKQPDSGEGSRDISETDYQDYLRTMKKFHDWQNKIANIFGLG